MMKGIVDLYDKTCVDLDGIPFIDWLMTPCPPFAPGQFCSSVVWYIKRKRWYLEEYKYDPYREELSTWFARELSGSFPPAPSQSVMKYFELEKDEHLITTNSKVRPLILLQRHVSDWWNPLNTAKHVAYWLCLPLFRYKDRHNQEYVISHQRLQDAGVFYIPSFYAKNPGVDSESAARFHALQMIRESHLSPLKCMCTAGTPTMNRPFKLTGLGLRLLLYHFYRSTGCLTELSTTNTEYDLFKDQVNRLLDAAAATA